MAKLGDLKALVDAARERAARTSATTPGGPGGTPHEHARATMKTPARRHIGAAKHADGDIDLAQAFADVTRLPPRNSAVPTRPRPAPLARLRMEDERAALELSKYGAEPAHAWDIGKELDGEQTFVRSGLGSDVLSKLRRGHWVVQ